MSNEQSKFSRTIFNAKEKRVIEPFQKMLTRANGDIDEAITDALQPVDWIERVLRGQKYRSYRVAVPTA